MNKIILLAITLASVIITNCSTMKSEVISSEVTQSDIEKKYGMFTTFEIGKVSDYDFSLITNSILQTIYQDYRLTPEERTNKIEDTKKQFSGEDNLYYGIKITSQLSFTPGELNFNLSIVDSNNDIIDGETSTVTIQLAMSNSGMISSTHYYYILYHIKDIMRIKSNSGCKLLITYPDGKKQVNKIN